MHTVIQYTVDSKRYSVNLYDAIDNGQEGFTSKMDKKAQRMISQGKKPKRYRAGKTVVLKTPESVEIYVNTEGFGKSIAKANAKIKENSKKRGGIITIDGVDLEVSMYDNKFETKLVEANDTMFLMPKVKEYSLFQVGFEPDVRDLFREMISSFYYHINEPKILAELPAKKAVKVKGIIDDLNGKIKNAMKGLNELFGRTIHPEILHGPPLDYSPVIMKGMFEIVKVIHPSYKEYEKRAKIYDKWFKGCKIVDNPNNPFFEYAVEIGSMLDKEIKALGIMEAITKAGEGESHLVTSNNINCLFDRDYMYYKINWKQK